MTNIVICNPKIEDAKASIEVQYKAWLDTYPNEEFGITIDDIEDRYKDAFGGERLSRREKAIVDPKSNEKIMVAKDGDRVVGMIYVTVEEKINQLRALYILPEYQRMGIGSKLWNSIKPFLDKDKIVLLEVVEYNKKAKDFYNRLGFIDTGKRFTDEKFRMKSGSIMPEMVMKLDKSLLQ